MLYTKDFSVIVPCWRGAIKFLPTLLDSIPQKENIEIIVIDNSKEPVVRDEIESDREIVFLHSAPERHAGGSRNDGMKVAKGKWLLFADADDYYTKDAFDVFYECINTDAEVVYTGMGGIYLDTGEPSERGDYYKRLVHGYCEGDISELGLRIGFTSPCCKMVSHALVDREGLRYDEVRASNDAFFSLTTGLFAKKIMAIDRITYIATVNHGSLTKRIDYEVIKARYIVALRCNRFKKDNNLRKYQESIMYYLYECRHFGLSKIFEFIGLLIKYKQNPLIGWKRWGTTRKRRINNEAKEKEYIIRK